MATHNIYHGRKADEFICEKCRIHLISIGEQMIVKDGREITDVYEMKYCPNCGEEIEVLN